MTSIRQQQLIIRREICGYFGKKRGIFTAGIGNFLARACDLVKLITFVITRGVIFSREIVTCTTFSIGQQYAAIVILSRHRQRIKAITEMCRFLFALQMIVQLFR